MEDKYKEGFCALLVFMRGAEGVEKPETESDRKRTGEGRPLGRLGGGGFPTSAGTRENIKMVELFILKSKRNTKSLIRP